MSGVALDRISRSFQSSSAEPIFALCDLTLGVEQGEFFVVVGPSGAGKSTLLRLIAGLEKATSGSIVLDGQAANDLAPDKRDVAMVFQQDALFPHLTIYQNIGLGLRLQKVPKAEIDQRVRHAARWLELESHLQRFPRELSGGERQRVALARAMVRKPKIFLFDEPLSNLDPPWRERLRAEIRRIHREFKSTVIYVTHDQAEAMSLADRLAVLDRGMLQQVGTPEQIYDMPANLFVATFFGSPAMNMIPGGVELRDGQFCFASDSNLVVPIVSAQHKALSAFAGKQVLLGLRPEHVGVRAADPLPFQKPVTPVTPVTRPENIGENEGGDPLQRRCENGRGRYSAECPAMVADVERIGSDVILHLLVGKKRLRAKVPAEGKLVNGQSCHLELMMERANWFDPDTGLRVT